tara:strand:+ start:110 stop:706 length:597 start_codon:yes stop_codon:yes gene_type:complete
MRLLDLFSGTHSVGNVARDLAYEVVSLDRDMAADINIDILLWDYTVYDPTYFDVVWASPPCQYFSHMRAKNIGRCGYTKESIEQDLRDYGLPVLYKTLEILDYFKPRLWFMENPQTGRMKEFVDRPYYDVDYCMYGFDYRKRTRVWTNKLNFQPKLCNKHCGFVVNNRHAMQVNSRGGCNDRKMRYRIPEQLVRELLT